MSDMENTEYTPTTDWVRAAYTRAVPESLVASQVEMMAEFDRWLSAHDAQVAAAALESIAGLTRGANSYGVESVPTDWILERAAAYRVEGEGKNDVHE